MVRSRLPPPYKSGADTQVPAPLFYLLARAAGPAARRWVSGPTSRTGR